MEGGFFGCLYDFGGLQVQGESAMDRGAFLFCIDGDNYAWEGMIEDRHTRRKGGTHSI